LPCGRARTPWTRREQCPKNARESDAVCTLEIDPRFAAALTGVETCTHLLVLYWMDKSRRDLVLQAPRCRTPWLGGTRRVGVEPQFAPKTSRFCIKLDESLRIAAPAQVGSKQFVVALELQQAGSPRRLQTVTPSAAAVGLFGQLFGTQKHDSAREVVYGGP
jgi:hypothetical protein